MPETSIIIRTKNEEKWIGEVLKRLSKQSYKNFEIIIVDSGSTDKTLDIIKNYNVRLLKIKPEEFSYPFALNYGCIRASGEKYFVFISGHALPCSKTWLEDGLKNFRDTDVLGVYGYTWALSDASIREKLCSNKYWYKLKHIFDPKIIVYEGGMGVMGFTNAIIRRDLWEKRHFNEEYGLGGEDGEWAGYWLERGFNAIKDIKFSVYHSHGLNRIGIKKQFEHWSSLGSPRPFKFPEYRNKYKRK